MHLKRVIVAALAIPLLYLYITKLPPVFFLILLIAVAAAAQIEFHKMYKTAKSISFIGIITGIFILASSYFSPEGLSGSALFIIFMISFIFISSARLFIRKDPSSSLRDISPAITGLLYIPNLLLAQWYLRLEGYEWIILLYGCVWASDSLAYYIGKGFGKRKLYKEVSPHKTVAGAFGSVAGGILSALLLGSLMFNKMGIFVLIVIGSTIGAITIVGDLVESMFKRDAGVKDSGALIPGHGGILDKIDGVLFAGPVLYWIKLSL